MAGHRWRRTPYGYLSDDGRWFLERGGRMSHGTNAWLVWRAATDEDVSPDCERPDEFVWFGRNNECIRPFAEVVGVDSVPGIDGPERFIDALTEGGWLSEAKEIVEQLSASAAA